MRNKPNTHSHLPLLFPLPLLLLLLGVLPGKNGLGLGVGVGVAYGQGSTMITPDCQSYISLSTAATTATFDNRFAGCVTWTVQYTSTGFTGLTLTFQSAQGAATPGTFGAYGGTTITGANPMTSATTCARIHATEAAPTAPCRVPHGLRWIRSSARVR